MCTQFGRSIYKKFYKAYTGKYWCEEPNNLDVNWISNRIYRPSLKEILKGALSNKTENVYYAKEMRYPTNGGFISFLKPMLDNVNIKLNKRAALIDPCNKYVEFEDGEKIYYDKLISSIPLPELIKIVKDALQNIIEASKKLKSTSMRLVSVGFNRPDVSKYLWFYIYDKDILPARVYAPNIKSPNNVPKGFSALQFEIYESENRKIGMNNDLLCEYIENILNKMKLATNKDILFMNVHEEKYANVIFYKDMIKYREIIHNYLQQIDIQFIGRFGEWDYFWTDQAFISGLNKAKTLLNRG